MPGESLALADKGDEDAGASRPASKSSRIDMGDLDKLAMEFKTGFPSHVVKWAKSLTDSLVKRLESNMNIDVLFWGTVCTGSDIVFWIMKTIAKILREGLKINTQFVYVS